MSPKQPQPQVVVIAVTSEEDLVRVSKLFVRLPSTKAAQAKRRLDQLPQAKPVQDEASVPRKIANTFDPEQALF
jgi:hypothetical protein